MIKYSEQFTLVLSRISYNKIAQSILNLRLTNPTDYLYDYIDTTDGNSIVSFTPAIKVKSILESLPKTTTVLETRNLTYSNSNNHIFEMLGYDKNSQEYWIPEPGTTGTMLRECVSQTSGKTYVLFKCDNTGRLSVINKTALKTSIQNEILFKTNRNNIKIGRLASNMLKGVVEFTPKEIEEFVNLYKSSYDFTNNSGVQFKIVSGKDIAKWYKKINYKEGGGVLNNSCMCEKPEEFFQVYTENKNCSMIILHTDDGQLKDNEYTSDKIKGRALLWDTVIDGEPVKFMDRVYTVNDSDVKLFEEWARENGWWYKAQQSMYPSTPLTNGEITKEVSVLVQLDIEPKHYPYMDTMCFFVDGYLTNDGSKKHSKEFRTTHGGYVSVRSNGDREEIYIELED